MLLPIDIKSKGKRLGDLKDLENEDKNLKNEGKPIEAKDKIQINYDFSKGEKQGDDIFLGMTYAEIRAYKERLREIGEDGDKEDEEKTCFMEFTKILKYIFFADTGRILKNSNASTRELEAYDIQRMPSQFKNEIVCKRFYGFFRKWEKECNDPKKKVPMWRVYLRMEKKSIIISTVLRMIADIILILIPLMMIQYEDGFKYQDIGAQIGTQTVTLQAGKALGWACAIFLAYLIQYMCRQHSERLIVNSKFRIEQALKDQLFKKLLTANYISIAQSDPNQVSKILFFGIDNIMAMLMAIPAVISAPIAIILGCFLVARAHSNFFFLGAIIVYLLICFYAIDHFNGVSARYQAKYDSAQSMNSIKVEEFFDNITTIQTNSLGKCLKVRFYHIRKMANDTLKYLHLATGIAEVLLTLSPFLFTALAMTLYTFAEIGSGSESDSTRLMVCAMAPMTIPIKVITDTLYKRRLFVSSFALVIEFLDSLRSKEGADKKEEEKKNIKHRSNVVVIKMTDCSFVRDHNMQETFETIINPKKDEFVHGKDKFVIFKDPLNKVSTHFQILANEEARKRQMTLINKFSTGEGESSNVSHCLKNINLRVSAKMKICVVGDENSGVNDFFLALMNELILKTGAMQVKGTACYLDMNNPKFIRDTIKENILLGREFNKALYLKLIEDVIHLRLKKYPLKDRTVVVEGQKNIAENDVARILLARLLYSNADVVMMNNYFDKLPKERRIETYEGIVEDYLKERTVIFSTKIVHLMKKADRVIVMKDGMIVNNDTYANLMNNRASHLYKYLMNDPAGNTNLFKKVLDLFKVSFREIENGAEEHQEDPIAIHYGDSMPKTIQTNKSPIGKLFGDTKNMRTGQANVNNQMGDKKPSVSVSGPAGANVAGAAGSSSNEQQKDPITEREKRKNRRKVASTGEESNSGNSLAKLQKNIMYNGSLSTKVVFIGQSSLKFYIFFFSLLVTNISMGANLLETCIWGRKVSFLDTYTDFLLAYDLLVIFYLAVVIVRDGIFTQMVIKNLNHLYNLMTNSLIDTQKEYLLQNPSTRIVYIMTKTIAKIDRDLMRSYYKLFDSSLTLLVILGALNYFLYIFMSIVTIFVLIIIMPAYSYFNVGCIKLSNFTTNHSSDLVEVFLSSFNFILPLRNHNISGYFSKKFTECADTVMRAKVRLEDDILRWFHLRFMIYSTFLVVCILFFPIIVINFLGSSFLTAEWQFKFVSASVPMLVPVLLNFANSMTETSENIICVKSIIKYVLELSKNSEDASIIQQLAAMPVKKSKYVDMEDIQETNLTNFILKDHSTDIELKSIGNAPSGQGPNQDRSLASGGSELARKNTQVPGDKKKKPSQNEPTKPLLMLQNVYYESKIAEQILKGINLKLYEAERVGIICELGSGKDFLINLLMTLMQKSDIPENGPSQYEIRGTPVTLATAAELRKSMTYLYPNPSLLMGTVRDNIDPFKRYTDEEIMRTMHFLKMVRALQEYSGLFVCEDIEMFLASKQNTVEIHEISLAEIKPRVVKDLTEVVVDEKKSKKGRGTRAVTQGPGSTNVQQNKNRGMQPLKEKQETIAKEMRDKRNKTIDKLKELDGGQLDSPTSNNYEEGEEEEDDLEDDLDKEDEKKPLQHSASMSKLDKMYDRDLMEKRVNRKLFKKYMKEIKRIFLGANYSIESKEDEQVREFFELQFINEFPIPMPIPERAKRLDDELEDFDMNYENHHIHFEDERKLMETLLKMEVGQNGRNLNEDCRKIIMLTKVYLDKPPIIVYDEDALFIHGVNRSFYIKQLFQNLRESGIMGFVKDLSQIYHYSNTIILEKGEIIEQDPPLDLIDNQQSHLYRIVMRDDIRTLKQLENRLEKEIIKYDRLKRKELMSVGKSKVNHRANQLSKANSNENGEKTEHEIVEELNEQSSNLFSPRPESSKASAMKNSRSSVLLKKNQPLQKSKIIFMSHDEENMEEEDENSSLAGHLPPS